MEKNKNYSLYLLLVAFLTCFTTQNSMASEYAITFSKSGIVSPLDSIVVINHTKGTKVKLAEGDVLGLNVIASINQIADNRELINIYPNPVTENSKLTFYAKKAGNTVIKVMALDGKTVTQTTNNLAEGNNTFFLALPKGAYAISIDGSGFSYSAKALSQTTNSIKPSIELSTAEQTQTKGMQKSKSASVNMEYQTGDKMQYKGYSGPYCNTVADVPTASKIVNFKYAECKDASGNYYYNFVTIGAQVWMVDNLRTTKFNNGVSFNNYTSDAVWNNLEAIRKTPGWCN
ncbi:MAG: T9SS type A sorting domain-containing protein, partial [Paludibacter sp.]